MIGSNSWKTILLNEMLFDEHLLQVIFGLCNIDKFLGLYLGSKHWSCLFVLSYLSYETIFSMYSNLKMCIACLPHHHFSAKLTVLPVLVVPGTSTEANSIDFDRLSVSSSFCAKSLLSKRSKSWTYRKLTLIAQSIKQNNGKQLKRLSLRFVET